VRSIGFMGNLVVSLNLIFRGRIREAFVGLLLLISSLAFGQTQLTPNWTKYGFPYPEEYPKFNATDASRVLFWHGYNLTQGLGSAFAVYSVKDGALLAKVNTTPSITGATLSPDGKKVYYATDLGSIFSYDIATQTQTVVTGAGGTGNTNFPGPRFLQTSRKGDLLAYVIRKASTATDQIGVYSFTSGKAVNFDMKNTGTGSRTGCLKFVGGDTLIALSGPSIYDLSGSGVPIYATGNLAADVAVSPDQKTIYTLSQDTNTHAQYLAAYNTSSSTPLWKPVAAPGLFTGASLTADGKAILLSSFSNTSWTVSGIKASDGSALPNAVTITIPYTVQAPLVTGIPGSVNGSKSQILIGPGDESTSLVYSVDSSTGVGSAIGTFFEGNCLYAEPTLQSFNMTISGAVVPVVATYEDHPSGSQADNRRTMIRAVSNGADLLSLPYGIVISPDGAFYAYASGTSFAVYKITDLTRQNAVSAATMADGKPVTALFWGGPKKLVASSEVDTYVYPFDGKSLSASPRSFPYGYSLSAHLSVKIAPDGSKIAFSHPDCHIFNADTGIAYATIADDSKGGYGIQRMTFSNTGRIGVETLLGTSNNLTTLEYRIFDMNGANLTAVRTFTHIAEYDLLVSSSVALSPDGLNAVLRYGNHGSSDDPRVTDSVGIYSVATGALIQRWDNQFIPDGGTYGYPFAYSTDGSVCLWTMDGGLVAVPSGNITLGLTLAASKVIGGASTTGTLLLQPAPQADTVIALKSSSTSAIVPASASVKAGATTVTFTVKSLAVDASTAAKITATGPAGSGLTATAALTVTPPTSYTIALNPATVDGGQPSTGTITLNGNAGPKGVVVTLTSKNTAVATVPTSALVPAGSKVGTFQIATSNPTASTKVEIDGSALSVKASTNLTVLPNLIVFVIPSVKGGNALQLRVILPAAAGTGGVKIALASSNLAVLPLTGRTSVTVPAGATTADFGLPTLATLTDQSVTLTATPTGGQAYQASATVLAPLVTSVTCPVSATFGAVTTYATVVLDGIAPANFVLPCSSTSTSITVPATYTVPAKSASGTVKVTIKAVKAPEIVTVTIGGKAFMIALFP